MDMMSSGKAARQNEHRMKAYSYIRFSSKRQITGHSLKRQHEACVQFCRDRGLTLDTSLTFRDLGVSAFRSKNKEEGALAVFLKAVDDSVIEQGSYLVVESFDRLSRDRINKAAELFFRIINAGIILVTLAPSPEIYTADNCQLQNVLVALLVMARANEESATKSKRVRDAWADKLVAARSGAKITAKAPGWLTLIDGGFVENQHGGTVKRIFELSSQGHGSGEIARLLNTENIPYWGYTHKWNSTALRLIITGRAVLGEIQPTTIINDKRVAIGEPITGYYPQVIDENLWLKVNAQIQSRRVGSQKGRKSDFVNLFPGLLFEAKTKTTMVIGNKGRGRFYFSWKASQATCGQHLIDVELVEAAFLQMTNELKPSDLTQAKTDNTRRIDLEGTLARFQLQIGETESLIEASDGSIQLLLKQLQNLEAKRDDTQKELQELKSLEVSADEKHVEGVQSVYRSIAKETDKKKLRSLRIKLRGLVATLVNEIWMLVEPLEHGKRNILCKMQVFFKDGGFREYHILKVVGTKRQRGEVIISANRQRLWEPMPTLDLRQYVSRSSGAPWSTVATSLSFCDSLIRVPMALSVSANSVTSYEPRHDAVR